MGRYAHLCRCLFQEVFEELELWHKARGEATEKMEQKLYLIGMFPVEENCTRLLERQDEMKWIQRDGKSGIEGEHEIEILD